MVQPQEERSMPGQEQQGRRGRNSVREEFSSSGGAGGSGSGKALWVMASSQDVILLALLQQILGFKCLTMTSELLKVQGEPEIAPQSQTKPQ